ncbi:hypothetical protein KEM48_006158 [Puccinia striiformis f. sp. tritici PST-130]|nr:hypothetical protein KEM48_006158 [Puccinia striiformis f. sp. tritici PST-130]
MPNIPCSLNGQFACQPLNQTPNCRLPASDPILDLPNVQVQGSGGNSSTSCDATNLANQIINNEEEKGEEQVEDLDGQVVDNSLRSGNTTPIPESNSNTILVEVLRQLSTVTTKLTAASSLAPPKPCPAFQTPQMKRPDNFDGSSPAKLRNFLQQCKLIFRNNLDAFSSDLKKTLYALAFLTGKAFEHDQLTNFQKPM